MKRKLLLIAKKNGVEIKKYKTYRSDMGWQCYEIECHKGDSWEQFEDSYCVGESGAKEYLLNEFEQFIKKISPNESTNTTA